jgi:hypothetical protein
LRARLVRRARVVLMSDAGVSGREIAFRLERFAGARLGDPLSVPRRGRACRVSEVGPQGSRGFGGNGGAPCADGDVRTAGRAKPVDDAVVGQAGGPDGGLRVGRAPARVDALVTRSISGHLTERMQHHYSTVNADEQRQGIAKVIELTRTCEAPEHVWDVVAHGVHRGQAETSDADGASSGAPGGLDAWVSCGGDSLMTLSPTAFPSQGWVQGPLPEHTKCRANLLESLRECPVSAALPSAGPADEHLYLAEVLG